jgi:hypothetical protein
MSELAVISSRIGEELDQQARGPASAAARRSVKSGALCQAPRSARTELLRNDFLCI